MEPATNPNPQWKRTILRVFLLLGVLAYLTAILIHLLGQWQLQRPGVESVARGLRWSPGDPSLWKEYARRSLRLFEGSGAETAVEAYERAVALNPLDTLAWDGLATAYLQLGKPEKAEAAMRASLVAMPRSPQAAWRLANFLIQQGRTEQALPYLRTAGSSDRNLLVPVFDLGWKLLADPDRLLSEVVPQDSFARETYLRFLLRRNNFLDAYPVWAEVRSSRTASVLRLGHEYAETLAAAGLGKEAAKVWAEVLDLSERSWTKPPGEFLTNGGFEAPVADAGLGWRLRKDAGYQISPDEFVAQQGSRSLRITFDGSSNPDFWGVRQVVPVEPNRAYRFQGYLKIENISSDRGPFFSISSIGAPPEERFAVATESRIGTLPWTLEELTFRTGPNTSVVQIALRRAPSRKLNNRIQGKVWMDHLSLTALPK